MPVEASQNNQTESIVTDFWPALRHDLELIRVKLEAKSMRASHPLERKRIESLACFAQRFQELCHPNGRGK